MGYINAKRYNLLEDTRRVLVITLLVLVLSACGKTESDDTSPVISNISTSGKVVVISDCSSTSVTITAKATDENGISDVRLWYRMETDPSFESRNMVLGDGQYAGEIKGSDLQGHSYGIMEFYITAKDRNGNLAQSAVNNEIQFLPCVNN